MDFVQITSREIKGREKGSAGSIEVSCDFVVSKRNRDLMVRGGAFYAIWDEENNTWSTDEYDVQRLIDKDLDARVNELRDRYPDRNIFKKDMSNYGSKKWTEYRAFLKNLPNSYTELDTKLTFASTVTKRSDYSSKRLPYDLVDGEPKAYNELMSVLYSEDERRKIEWAIGAVIAGDVMKIQKFVVFYGEAGTGKSTVLNIIQEMFPGYYILFDAKALTSGHNQFATAQFRHTSLIAIQHDGDLSRLEDNSKLNSIVSHEEILVNEKHKSDYTVQAHCFLFMGSNKPVQISDAKSGMLRRLIDVRPTGMRLEHSIYDRLMEQIRFEHGMIANHCLNVYKSMGKTAYNDYKPKDMMLKTNVFYNFLQDNALEFMREECISLNRAFEMFKNYCEDSNVDWKLPKHKFREELRNYFGVYKERQWIGDKQAWHVYSEFHADKFFDASYNEELREIKEKREAEKQVDSFLDFTKQKSIFDEVCKESTAQYASKDDIPLKKWDNVITKLSELDTSKCHFVLLESNHIVIDFDIKDENGKKNLELNKKEASNWPKTYAEVSKGGQGIHLHYIYDGDPTQLASLYSEGVEIKVFGGKSALRRKLSLCNNESINKISSGLPMKKVRRGKDMIDADVIKNEKHLRTLLINTMKKQYCNGTKPSVDFIKKLLDDAYASGMKYDVTTLRQDVLAFASRSTNHAKYCISLVGQMKFHSEEISENKETSLDDQNLVFYDIEIFSNLFLICYKEAGEGKPVHSMVNPSPEDVGKLFNLKLVGFNNRRFDDHMIYARYLGYTVEELYHLAHKMIDKTQNQNCHFREAYNISYADVWEFSANKDSLKKCEIELGIHHQELPIPWDEPVPDNMLELVIEYCSNDVIATEAVFNARQGDFLGRQILAAVSGGRINTSTNILTRDLIFGKGNKNPVLQYVDLATGEIVFDNTTKN